LCGLALALVGPAIAQETIIHAGHLITVAGSPARENQSIVIRDGSIVEVADGFRPSDGAVIDLSDAWVMPGFIDAHAHLGGDGELGDPYRRLAEAVRQSRYERAFGAIANARTLLMKGITTVKDVGDFGDGFSFAVRDAIAAGQIVGPRVLAAGPMIGPTGTQIDVWGFREELQEGFDKHKFGVCDGADACMRLIRENVKRGADAIKIKNTGGINCQFQGAPDPRFTAEELAAIVGTAHQLGRKVTAHAICTEGINEALKAGVDSIEHGTMMTGDSIRLFQETGAYLVGTLLAPTASLEAYEGSDDVRSILQDMVDNQMAMYGEAYRAGVNIAFGTDTGYTPHAMVSREFLLMAEAGMSPADVLKAATIGSATLLGLQSKTGTIESGKFADIVATASNPLKDARAFTDIGFVMKQGTVYKADL
jgi:imidazolonepropionase-like amidohydrolase